MLNVAIMGIYGGALWVEKNQYQVLYCMGWSRKVWGIAAIVGEEYDMELDLQSAVNAGFIMYHLQMSLVPF